MNYCVEAKHNDNCLKVVEELKDKLSSLDFYESKNQIDYCFSLGGDGTLLRSISKYYTKSPIFVGINLGNLGFLCSFNNFCHSKDISYKKVVDFLEYAKRNGLSKVTLSGGDPLARDDITKIIKKCFKLGLKVNLDTVGLTFINSS